MTPPRPPHPDSMSYNKQHSANRDLVAAAESGACEEVERCLAAGADVNARSSMMGAFDNNRARVGSSRYSSEVIYWDNKDFAVVERGDYARTALQAAADKGHEDIVSLLLKSGADINALPATYMGRGALQAAAESGHHNIMNLLIRAGANVNMPAARFYGRTALQAAAERGHVGMVTSLIDSGADVNAPPPIDGGGTALGMAVGVKHAHVASLLINKGAVISDMLRNTVLQLAAGGGYGDVVRLLIAKGADVNAPARRLTALQAAALSGHLDLVKFLINEGADVNAPPAQGRGKTALQAAALGGHEDIVTALIAAGADSNAQPFPDGGMEVLRDAVAKQDKVRLGLLIKAGINVSERDVDGETVLHGICLAGHEEVLEFLLGLRIFDLNMRDYRGSTPLHVAVRRNHLGVVKILISDESVALNITDNAGETPLQVALEKRFGEIAMLLLRSTVTLDGLNTEKLLGLNRQDAAGSFPICSALVLCESRPGYTFLLKDKLQETVIEDLDDEMWTKPTILLYIDDHSASNQSFVNPDNYVGCFSGQNHIPEENLLRWRWLNRNTSGVRSGKPPPPKIQPGIPKIKDVHDSKPAKVIFFSYISFDVPVDTDRDWISDSGVRFFQFEKEKIEISWVMRELESDDRRMSQCPAFRSVHYRGTLKMENLSIPNHAVDFCILFLDDVQRRWLKFLQVAKSHVAKLGELQLISAGQNHDIIKCLLRDILQWNVLSALLQLHLRKSKELLKSFETQDALYTELSGSIYAQTADGEVSGKERAIRMLLEKIEDLGKKCGEELADLRKDTKEMIDMEFSLVSIHEAVSSQSISMSMKRLSWITFIFLPLSFVSGLFGMNVNPFRNYPSWHWYVVSAAVTLILVLIVWILFKYLPIDKWIERHIGSRLRSTLSRPDPLPREPTNTGTPMGPGLNLSRLYGRMPQHPANDEERGTKEKVV